MQRLKTRAVKIGNLWIGAHHPIRIQTMTTTDTMDTEATVAQTIRCIQHSAELVRITAPSKKEAANLLPIKNELAKKNYHVPLVADIHYTPNAAEIAARIVAKVRINPGNYIDKKKFEQIEYTDEEYEAEISKIKTQFTPLIEICKLHETAIRIGTNHGSLSDRIMSRYGDTAMGMVESALEFVRIARQSDFHQIVLSMKSSNPKVMIDAYRLLVKQMQDEFGECYPLHLGVTEAGDGEDGRIKSAIGIGTLLKEGIGDTIRVSLTEEPELELPVCKNIIEQIELDNIPETQLESIFQKIIFSDPTLQTFNIPKVIADTSKIATLNQDDLQSVGYTYNPKDDKWHISDQAADFIFCNHVPTFSLPGTLGVLTYYEQWLPNSANTQCYPLFDILQYISANYIKHEKLNFVMIDADLTLYKEDIKIKIFEKLKNDKQFILCVSNMSLNSTSLIKSLVNTLHSKNIHQPVILISDSAHENLEKALIHYSLESGSLLLDGAINGLCLGYHFGNNNFNTETIKSQLTTLNSIAFGILQATRTRISKTEYISCPSCGRTLFDLQETTAKIRAVTHHLKGVKIAIMGCIVNGPGEMADADFGYVGSGVGKITLYKNKEIVKRNIDSNIAVDELINLLKENNVWIEN